jgi:hypothetical protein
MPQQSIIYALYMNVKVVNMIKFFLGFLFIACGICSANANNSDDFWSYGYSVPPYFPVSIEYIQAGLSNGKNISLRPVGMIGGYRPDNNLGYEIKPQSEKDSEQFFTNDPPTYIVVSWFSYAEKQFYAVNVIFDEIAKKIMKTPYTSSCDVNKVRQDFKNHIVIGLTPGTNVIVWLVDDCHHDSVMIGHFRAWKMKESLSGSKVSDFAESTEAYQKEFADILAKPIPFDKWK